MKMKSSVHWIWVAVRLQGLKNGKIVLWNGENDKGSKTYALIRELIQSQNF
jgi:hypothetical protein